MRTWYWWGWIKSSENTQCGCCIDGCTEVGLNKSVKTSTAWPFPLYNLSTLLLIVNSMWTRSCVPLFHLEIYKYLYGKSLEGPVCLPCWDVLSYDHLLSCWLSPFHIVMSSLKWPLQSQLNKWVKQENVSDGEAPEYAPAVQRCCFHT